MKMKEIPKESEEIEGIYFRIESECVEVLNLGSMECQQLINLAEDSTQREIEDSMKVRAWRELEVAKQKFFNSSNLNDTIYQAQALEAAQSKSTKLSNKFIEKQNEVGREAISIEEMMSKMDLNDDRRISVQELGVEIRKFVGAVGGDEPSEEEIMLIIKEFLPQDKYEITETRSLNEIFQHICKHYADLSHQESQVYAARIASLYAITKNKRSLEFVKYLSEHDVRSEVFINTIKQAMRLHSKNRKPISKLAQKEYNQFLDQTTPGFLEKSLNPEEKEEDFKAADTNGDGFVDNEELAIVMMEIAKEGYQIFLKSIDKAIQNIFQ